MMTFPHFPIAALFALTTSAAWFSGATSASAEAVVSNLGETADGDFGVNYDVEGQSGAALSAGPLKGTTWQSLLLPPLAKLMH